jgi:uncharacterized SAM-binding protein YcdF (DUF218 family)
VRRRFRWFLLAVFLILLLAIVTHVYWLSVLGGYLIHDEAAAPADLVVVLAGDYFGNRILTAAELVRRGLVPKALVSGPGDVYGMHESDLAVAFAVRHGFPESYFLPLPNNSTSTASEADAVIPELRKLQAHRIEIVTSNFHTRRAGNIYRSRAGDLEFHMVSSPDPYYSADGWWKNREGRKTFLVEWEKTIATWLGM